MKKIIFTLIFLFSIVSIASAEIGIASFYTVKSSGLVTANGERYNENAFTCASMTHKIGTLLKVTNIENGKAVIVRVNDRGGFKKKYNRVIDLTPRAFSAIGNLKQGLLKVKVEVMK